MQNLFATNMPGQVPSTGFGNLPNAQTSNYPSNQINLGTHASDYNTMQNLFATNLNPQGSPTNSPTFAPPKQVETFATGQAGNLQNTNNFNTMQNLFATNAQGTASQVTLNTGKGIQPGAINPA